MTPKTFNSVGKYVTVGITSSEVKYEVSEIMLLNLLKLIITLSFLLNYTTKLQKSPVLLGIFIRIRGYFVPTAILLLLKM